RLPEHAARLPQRHHAALRRGGGEAVVAAHARLLQAAPESLKPSTPHARVVGARDPVRQLRIIAAVAADVELDAHRAVGLAVEARHHGHAAALALDHAGAAVLA